MHIDMQVRRRQHIVEHGGSSLIGQQSEETRLIVRGIERCRSLRKCRIMQMSAFEQERLSLVTEDMTDKMKQAAESLLEVRCEEAGWRRIHTRRLTFETIKGC